MGESPSITEARTHMHGDREQARAAIVAELGLITLTSTHLDIVAGRAARIMDTGMGAVTVLVDDKQHLIARSGIDIPVLDRTTSFCTHVTAHGRAVTIRDATRAPFYAGNPAVGFTAASIRAYCGVPITTADGTVIAVLCAADARPRTFSSSQITALELLGIAARAIMLPMMEEPPALALSPALESVDNIPAWCHQDDLYTWIESSVPDDAALAAEAERRSRQRWTRLVRPLARLRACA